MNKAFADNPVELRTAVPAPHFDDRSVALRAQRVVPLEQIRTKLRLRRTLFLCGAFAVAIVLGAASALVAVRVKHNAPGNEITQIPEIAFPTETSAVPVELNPIRDSSEAPVQQPTKPIVTPPKRQEAVAERPRIVRRDDDRPAVQPSEEEQLEQIREAVLYERWQERRARRAARRERRNRSDRDLSRVDELFEGPRRPERP
jgi:hypothetical protein